MKPLVERVILVNGLNRFNKPGSPGFGRVAERALALLLLVPLVLICSACKRVDPKEEEKLDLIYGEHFAKAFSEANRFRAPYSEGEKASADLIVAELEKLGYRPERQAFASEADSGKTSENIVLRIQGTGFRLNKDEPDVLDFMNTNQELPEAQAGLGYDGKPVSGEMIPIDGAAAAQAPNSASEAVTEAPEASGQQASEAAQTVIRARTPGRFQIVFGAHYDTKIGAAEAEDYPHYDGINDNASSVAALMALARNLRGKRMGFDISLVFFGAGHDQYRGARVYAASLDEQDPPIENVVILDGIYAGDELYAHSGRNSLLPNRKYMMRRGLYRLTDVYLQYDVHTKFDVSLLTNQAACMVKVPALSDQECLYREFSLRDSDYLPFDEAGIPLVFMDSGDYWISSPDDFRETGNIEYEDRKGMVTGSDAESLPMLSEVFGEERLRNRINAAAFMLEKLAAAGIQGMEANG